MAFRIQRAAALIENFGCRVQKLQLQRSRGFRYSARHFEEVSAGTPLLDGFLRTFQLHDSVSPNPPVYWTWPVYIRSWSKKCFPVTGPNVHHVSIVWELHLIGPHSVELGNIGKGPVNQSIHPSVRPSSLIPPWWLAGFSSYRVPWSCTIGRWCK